MSHEWVKLVSNDGFEFVITRDAALISGTIRGMLSQSSNFTEATENKIHFSNIRATLLQRVCEYLCFHDKYKDAADVPDFEFPVELSLELLIAADFLHC